MENIAVLQNIFSTEFGANQQNLSESKFFAEQYVNQTLNLICFSMKLDFTQKIWFRHEIQVDFCKKKALSNIWRIQCKLKVIRATIYLDALSSMHEPSTGSVNETCCLSVFS